MTTFWVAYDDGAVEVRTENTAASPSELTLASRDVGDVVRLADLVLELDEAGVARRRLQELLLLVGLLLLCLARLRRLRLGLLLGLGLRLVGRHALGDQLVVDLLRLLVDLVLRLLLLLGDLVVELVELLLVVLRRRLQLHRDQERAVLALVELAVDRVVALARGRRVRQHADVLLAELEVERRQRQHDEQRDREEQREPVVLGRPRRAHRSQPWG